jgi:integrase
VLLGCALRRSEVAALTMGHVQQRDGRWCIVDLVGKHNRVRTVPMPAWVKVAIDAWTGPARVVDGSCSVPSTAATRSRVRCCPKRWSGKCSGPTRRLLASLVALLCL